MFHCGFNGEDASILLPRLFAEGRPIVGICAAGILIRLLAPHLSDKTTEPPVLAVSQDGAHVVPLLGGHHGANRLAREIAEIARRHGRTHHGLRREVRPRPRRAATRAGCWPTQRPRSRR